jgi:hypothetical protein
MNSTVHTSKKEVLLMRKLGNLGQCPNDNPRDASVAATAVDEGLTEVFTGPVDEEYFGIFRDIFPAVQALSDADFMPRSDRSTMLIESSDQSRKGLGCFLCRIITLEL